MRACTLGIYQPLVLMSTRLVLLGLLVALAVPAASAQTEGILVVRPVPSLTFDAGLGERAERLDVPRAARAASPRSRGALRGAAIGALTSFVVGAATTAVVALTESCNPGEDYVCGWHLAAAATVPLTVLSAGIGAAIGAATARPERVPPPATASE